MKITARDRKLLLAIVPLALVAGFWFLLLAPQREAAAVAGEQLAKQQQARDAVAARVADAEAAKTSFAADYAAVVRLGRAVPSNPDVPTVLVQLERAAHGTGIDFGRIQVGERVSASPAGAGAGAGAGQAAAGGAKPGASTPPAGAAPAASAGAPAATKPVPGLDSVSLELDFTGRFFDLADVFHRLKRFVRVANEDIAVKGRLIEVHGLRFQTDSFPRIKATLSATVYMASADKASATPGSSGPATGSPAAGAPSATPPAGAAGASSSTPPTAAVRR